MGTDMSRTVLEMAGLSGFLQGQRSIAQGWDDASRGMDTYNSASERMNRMSGMAATGAVALSGAGLVLGHAMLAAAGNVESNIKALEALTGSAEKARQIFGYLDQTSTVSFFNRTELMQAGRLLTAYGMDVRRFIPLSDDLAAAFKDQGVTIADTARAFGRLQSGDFGEAFERLRDFGISRKELEGQGLKFDKGGSYQGSVEEALSAVEKIVQKRFGGLSKMLATTTFEGAVSNWEDALERLKATGGEVLLPSATQAVKGLSDLVTQANEFAKAHPDFVRNAAAMGGFAVVAGLAAAAGFKVLSVYLNARDIIERTALAKKGLTAATVADIAAERTKAGVAAAEAAQIGNVGKSAATTAAQMGTLARAQAFLNKPVGGGLRTVGAFGADTFAVSRGAAMGSAAVGAVAGYGAYDDRAAMGDPNAALKGIGTGVAAAAASMFLPGAAVPIAIATGFRLAFNEAVNRPMERQATQSTGTQQSEENATSFRGMGHAERSRVLLEQSRTLSAEAEGYQNRLGSWTPTTDEKVGKGIAAEAESKRIWALQEGRMGRREIRQGQTDAEAATERRRKAADEAYWAEENRKNAENPDRFQPGGNRRPQYQTLSFDSAGNLQRNFPAAERPSMGDLNWQLSKQYAQGFGSGGDVKVGYQPLRNNDQTITLQIPRTAADDSTSRLHGHNRLR